MAGAWGICSGSHHAVCAISGRAAGTRPWTDAAGPSMRPACVGSSSICRRRGKRVLRRRSRLIRLLRCFCSVFVGFISGEGRRGEWAEGYLIDPALDLTKRCRAVAYSGFTPPITVAWRSVEEVLLHTEAGSRAKLWRCASQLAIRIVA